MNNNLKETLSRFDTLLLAEVKPEEDVYSSKFKFISNSFEVFGIKPINNFYDLLETINRTSQMCEGIGYYAYCNRIKEGIFFCLRDGIDTSFILPLQKGNQTLYFLMNINKSGDELCGSPCRLFAGRHSGIYLDVQSRTSYPSGKESGRGDIHQ